VSFDLSIIIVNWNVSQLLRQCLYSIQASPGVSVAGQESAGGYKVEVWVVDNASVDDSVPMVEKEFPWVHLIVNSENLGFTRANNQALRRARGRYLMLLNPDTRLVEDALARMLAFMEQNPTVGLLGPQLRYGDGSLQSSRRRFPTLAMALMESTLLEQWFPHNRWARAYRLEDEPSDHIQDVDWVTGACMLVRRQVLETVGLLDERFFMYSEELDWCRRIAQAGWRVVYFPQAIVVHYEGKSSDQAIAARHIHFEASKVFYFRKYHGRLQSEFLRLFLLGTYFYRLLEEGLKFLLGHKRALRKRRVITYSQVLRSGLRLSGAKV